ncbi:MAG: 50S ribosomal protein L22 [Alphaproteobacteria bacterium]|nr:50S ribosomal protein L22 [Alphaproteobacteria bacterium]
MGKQKTQRRIGDDSAKAIATTIRSSARKLNLVAASIRGMKVAEAVTALDYTKRRVAKDVKRVLQAAVANAENNHQLDVDKLVVAEASVGRAFVMKRWMARGRGKSSGVEKPFSNLTVVVQEKEIVAKRTKSKTPAKKTDAKAAPKQAKTPKQPAAKPATAEAGA